VAIQYQGLFPGQHDPHRGLAEEQQGLSEALLGVTGPSLHGVLNPTRNLEKEQQV